VEKAQVGKDNRFTVESRDRFDNPLTEGGANVGGELKGEGESVPIEVIDNEDGTYTCSYPGVRKAGVYELVPKLEGVPVKGAPFKLVVSPGDYSVDNTHILFPEVNISGMEGPVITLRDDHLNARNTGGEKIVAEIRRKTRLPPVKAHSTSDGTYEIDYPASLKGKYEASVTVNGKDAPGGPWHIDVEEGNFSDEHREEAKNLMPGASGALLRLLKGASEKEREKILKEIAALSSL